MIHIPYEEIKQPQLHADTLGFTFVWQGHFLRGIYPQSVEWARTFFDSGFINEVVDKGLFPKTWISDYENEQFGLILEHETISPVLYATEWNSAMLKDAALMVLDIAEIGWEYGYNMVDCHKLNVMFKDNRPMYVDLGSFALREEGSTGWKPYRNFLESYTYILDMWTHGCGQIAKRMMSPGVVLHTVDYMMYKHWIYRRVPFLWTFKNRLSQVLNSLAIVGYRKVNNNKIMKVGKRVVDVIKPGISQHFGQLRSQINSMIVVSGKRKSQQCSLKGVIDESFTSITCVNFDNILMLRCLAGGDKKLISINEDGSISNSEYKEHNNITSASFSLLNGEVLVRNKFPENRLSSDIVFAYCPSSKRGHFSQHNNLVYLERCMIYSTQGIMYVVMQESDKRMIDLLKKNFSVNIISEDETLIKVSKQS